MFESIKSMNIKEEEECEECGYEDVLVNAVIGGHLKRICQRCANTNPIVLIKEPRQVKEEEIPRRSVHEILEEMSGVKMQPIEKPASEIKLEDLRARYKELKEKKRLRRIETKRKLGIETKEEEEVEKLVEKKEEIEIPIETEVKEAYEELKEKKEIDFNIGTTKHTKIGDLLEKMKKIDEGDTEAEEKEEESKEEKQEKLENTESMESIETADREEKI